MQSYVVARVRENIYAMNCENGRVNGSKTMVSRLHGPELPTFSVNALTVIYFFPGKFEIR